MKAYYDADGECVHLGEWQLKETEEGEILNPLPEGLEVRDVPVTTDAKGGLHPESNYRNLRSRSYPSITDQLDALWKGGHALEEMRVAVLAVKETYPKVH